MFLYKLSCNLVWIWIFIKSYSCLVISSKVNIYIQQRVLFFITATAAATTFFATFFWFLLTTIWILSRTLSWYLIFFLILWSLFSCSRTTSKGSWHWSISGCRHKLSLVLDIFAHCASLSSSLLRRRSSS